MTDDTEILVRKLVDQHLPPLVETISEFMHQHDTEVGIEVVLDLVTSVVSMCLLSIHLAGSDEQETVKIIKQETLRKFEKLRDEYQDFMEKHKNKMN